MYFSFYFLPCRAFCLEQRLARSRCYEGVFVFEYLICSSTIDILLISLDDVNTFMHKKDIKLCISNSSSINLRILHIKNRPKT